MEKVSGFLLPISLSLVILAYTTLGVLALSTARADDNFAKRNIQFNTAFYLAEGEFEKNRGELHQFLDSQKEGENRIEAAKGFAISKGWSIVEEQKDSLMMVFEIQVNENVMYRGKLKLQGDKVQVIDQGTYGIDQWEEEFIEVWSGD